MTRARRKLIIDLTSKALDAFIAVGLVALMFMVPGLAGA